MKVLFLDFDGVLNSKQHFLATKDIKIKGAENLMDANLLRMKHDTNSSNMWVLGYIMKKVPDLQIVISSAWRSHYDLTEFSELFTMYKLDGSRIIDKTPKKFSSNRYEEIHMWLREQLEPPPHDCPVDISDGPCGECDNAIDKIGSIDFVVVDDHPVFPLEDPEKSLREFLTDSWVGLTMNDAFKIIRHFNPNFEEPIMYI